MKIPGKHTSGHAICQFIYDQGAQTGPQVCRWLEPRWSRSTLVDKLDELLEMGVLIALEDKLTVSQPVRRYFEQCEADELGYDLKKPVTSTAAPRSVKPFTPLKNYKLNVDGMREGAGDHRQWKSRHF